MRKPHIGTNTEGISASPEARNRPTTASALLAVAPSAARICEGPASRREEPPLVGLRMEGELQHAISIIVVCLAVSDGLKDGVVALPSCANHKLPDPSLGICSAFGVLGCEALVVVLMAGEHHVYARCVQSVPYGLHFLDAAMFHPRAEARMVEVGKRAALVAGGSEVRLQPPHLRRGTEAVID